MRSIGTAQQKYRYKAVRESHGSSRAQAGGSRQARVTVHISTSGGSIIDRTQAVYFRSWSRVVMAGKRQRCVPQWYRKIQAQMFMRIPAEVCGGRVWQQ